MQLQFSNFANSAEFSWRRTDPLKKPKTVVISTLIVCELGRTFLSYIKQALSLASGAGCLPCMQSEFFEKVIPQKKKVIAQLTNREALTVLCSVVKHAGSSQSTKEVQGETRDVVEYFSLLLSCSSCFLRALLKKTEHSQGFSICNIIKNLLNSPLITFNFQNKLQF